MNTDSNALNKRFDAEGTHSTSSSNRILENLKKSVEGTIHTANVTSVVDSPHTYYQVQKIISIDKTFHIPFNLKYHKTKQIVKIPDRDSLFSKFARGRFNNNSIKKLKSNGGTQLNETCQEKTNR